MHLRSENSDNIVDPENYTLVRLFATEHSQLELLSTPSADQHGTIDGGTK